MGHNVCVCVCGRERIWVRTREHSTQQEYVCTHVRERESTLSCVMCVCVWERGRQNSAGTLSLVSNVSSDQGCKMRLKKKISHWRRLTQHHLSWRASLSGPINDPGVLTIQALQEWRVPGFPPLSPNSDPHGWSHDGPYQGACHGLHWSSPKAASSS